VFSWTSTSWSFSWRRREPGSCSTWTLF
jgi:hypothetical protein